MVVLHIEHPVPDFNGWKKAFDSDPVNRRQSGVRRYRVFRELNNPNFVMLELEFDNVTNAEAMLTALKKLWNQVEGKIMVNPEARITELVESREY
jgi:hypothetical protein